MTGSAVEKKDGGEEGKTEEDGAYLYSQFSTQMIAG